MRCGSINEEGTQWLNQLESLAASHGCRLICDERRCWRESVYLDDYAGGGPVILAGVAGTPSSICTTILHELGHHRLARSRIHPSDPLRGEVAAWNVAEALAREHGLPFVARIRREALGIYRRSLLETG